MHGYIVHRTWCKNLIDSGLVDVHQFGCECKALHGVNSIALQSGPHAVRYIPATSGKHEGRLWASLGSLERSKALKDVETTHLLGDRYIFFQRHGHL